jgi:hypothetical protein
MVDRQSVIQRTFYNIEAGNKLDTSTYRTPSGQDLTSSVFKCWVSFLFAEAFFKFLFECVFGCLLTLVLYVRNISGTSLNRGLPMHNQGLIYDI